MAAKTKKAPAAQREENQKPTYSREESTKYLAEQLTKVINGEKIGKGYAKVAGYHDSRRNCLTQSGLERFGEEKALVDLHTKNAEQYPERAKQIMTEHKDLLMKMFNGPANVKSLSKPEYASVGDVLEQPLRQRNEKGGLIYEAYKVAKENDMTDLIDASQKYREKVRTQVLAPLYMAQVYVAKEQGQAVSQDDEKALKEGISVTQDGKKVNKPFVDRGTLTPTAVNLLKGARKSLGGAKSKVINNAIQISDNKSRRRQIAAPRPKKEEKDVEMEA